MKKCLKFLALLCVNTSVLCMQPDRAIDSIFNKEPIRKQLESLFPYMEMKRHNSTKCKVLFFGESGAGKDSAIAMLAGSKMITVAQRTRKQIDIDEEDKKIFEEFGNAIQIGLVAESQTKDPVSLDERAIEKLYQKNHKEPPLNTNNVLYSTPGFGDTSGGVNEVLNFLKMQSLFDGQLKFMLVLGMDVNEDDQIKYIDKFLRLVGKIDYRSVGLVFTKHTPQSHGNDNNCIESLKACANKQYITEFLAQIIKDRNFTYLPYPTRAKIGTEYDSNGQYRKNILDLMNKLQEDTVRNKPKFTHNADAESWLRKVNEVTIFDAKNLFDETCTKIDKDTVSRIDSELDQLTELNISKIKSIFEAHIAVTSHDSSISVSVTESIKYMQNAETLIKQLGIDSEFIKYEWIKDLLGKRYAACLDQENQERSQESIENTATTAKETKAIAEKRNAIDTKHNETKETYTKDAEAAQAKHTQAKKDADKKLKEEEARAAENNEAELAKNREQTETMERISNVVWWVGIPASILAGGAASIIKNPTAAKQWVGFLIKGISSTNAKAFVIEWLEILLKGIYSIDGQKNILQAFMAKAIQDNDSAGFAALKYALETLCKKEIAMKVLQEAPKLF